MQTPPGESKQSVVRFLGALRALERQTGAKSRKQGLCLTAQEKVATPWPWIAARHSQRKSYHCPEDDNDDAGENRME